MSRPHSTLSSPFSSRKPAKLIAHDRKLVRLLEDNFAQLTEQDQKTASAIFQRPVESWTLNQSDWCAAAVKQLGLKVPAVTKLEKKPLVMTVHEACTRLPLKPPVRGVEQKWKERA